MDQTRPRFTHDQLLSRIKDAMEMGLKRQKINNKAADISDIDCLMSGLAVFSLKHASLLQFDREVRRNEVKLKNLKHLFLMQSVPCDTQMRERLDCMTADVIRPAFLSTFRLLQRGKELENFRFIGNHYALHPFDWTELSPK